MIQRISPSRRSAAVETSGGASVSVKNAEHISEQTGLPERFAEKALEIILKFWKNLKVFTCQNRWHIKNIG